MATKIELIQSEFPVIVHVKVIGINEWSISYNSSFDGQHPKDVGKHSEIKLGSQIEMKGRIDNWEFGVADVNEDTVCLLTWKQGEYVAGKWKVKGKEGQAIYAGNCIYIQKEES